jgi:hypothetical protein
MKSSALRPKSYIRSSETENGRALRIDVGEGLAWFSARTKYPNVGVRVALALPNFYDLVRLPSIICDPLRLMVARDQCDMDIVRFRLLELAQICP